LADSGLSEATRVIYTSDHGEMLGEHGLWWKSSMYEGAVSVPMIMAGPDVSEGDVVRTNVSLLDVFPTLVDAVGGTLMPEDAALPGRSLLQVAQEDPTPRTVFSEYHAIFSPTGIFMVRDEQYKYIHFSGYPSQLFDMQADPDEMRDLASDPAHGAVRAACEQKLRAIVDPEEVDRRARADQWRRVEAAGGIEKVVAGGVKVPYTPAPDEFGPAPVEARKRSV
jgi:choline-sulfatase